MHHVRAPDPQPAPLAMTRQPRHLRQCGIVVEPTNRDRELLLALSRLRIVRTGALVRLCFGGVRRDTAARRLRRLFDAGFLAVRDAPALTDENLYLLGPKSQTIVRQVGATDVSAPRGGLDHHLAIVDTWVALATLEVPGVSLHLARADWELRAEFPEALTVVPDLFAVFEGPCGPRAMAVEVDLGTEPLKVLRAKLATYGQLTAAGSGLLGWGEFAIGLAVRGRGRLPYLRELLSTSWLGRWCLWSIEEGPVGEIRRLAHESMTPLASSPCGKGRGEAVSAREARDRDA